MNDSGVPPARPGKRLPALLRRQAECSGILGQQYLFPVPLEQSMRPDIIPTGISGLDEILGGGLPGNHIYLLMGNPGTGKTTLGLQYLLEGVRRKEKTLYLTFMQTVPDLEETAASHGWDLSGIAIKTFLAEVEKETSLAEQTLLPSAEIQLHDLMNNIEETVREIRPTRLVFDSVEQFRLLSGEPAIFRQRLLKLLKLLADINVTAFFTESSVESSEFKTLVHGIIELDMVVPPANEIRRRLLVLKLRNTRYAGGYHCFCIRTGGLVVFPRLPQAGKALPPRGSAVKSGIESLDAMLGGGLEEGTACFIVGQSGTGKSMLATAYVHAMGGQGEASIIFLFEERREIFLQRAAGAGMDLAPLIERNLLEIRQVNIGDWCTDEFAHNLRHAVEQRQVRAVVIDSLTGFSRAAHEEPQLVGQLHDMLAFLGRHRVLSLLTVTSHGLTGETPDYLEASYLADTIIWLRRFEAMGSFRLALSVLKKRYGDHGKSIREFRITANGASVGEPLREFQGILSGIPVYTGKKNKLMRE